MRGPTSEALEAGLRAVRKMADDPAPANDQPNSVVSANAAEKTGDVSSHSQAEGESPSHAPDAAGDDVFAADGTNMGTRQEAETRFLDKVNQWRKTYAPAMDTAAGHKRRTLNEHEARFQLAGASAHLAWFMENAADPATSRIRALEEANRALVEAGKQMRCALHKVTSLDWSKRQDAVEYLLMMDKECRQAVAAYDRLGGNNGQM